MTVFIPLFLFSCSIQNLPSSSEEIEKLTLRLAEVETELSCVTKDRDSALAAVANLKISKEVLSKSNLELYEKLSKQNKTEKEVAIKNLQVAKEKISQLEADYRKLEEKHSKSLKENAEDIRKLIAKVIASQLYCYLIVLRRMV